MRSVDRVRPALSPSLECFALFLTRRANRRRIELAKLDFLNVPPQAIVIFGASALPWRRHAR